MEDGADHKINDSTKIWTKSFVLGSKRPVRVWHEKLKTSNPSFDRFILPKIRYIFMAIIFSPTFTLKFSPRFETHAGLAFFGCCIGSKDSDLEVPSIWFHIWISLKETIELSVCRSVFARFQFKKPRTYFVHFGGKRKWNYFGFFQFLCPSHFVNFRTLFVSRFETDAVVLLRSFSTLIGNILPRSWNRGSSHLFALVESQCVFWHLTSLIKFYGIQFSDFLQICKGTWLVSADTCVTV